MYKVIVVEDEVLIRKHVVDFINQFAEGFTVVEDFDDGEDIIQYLRENHVDLIVTDVKMQNISGIQVAKYVFESNLPVKVIILSGYHDFAYAQEAINYNVQAYLTKPTDPVKFQEALHKIKKQLDAKETHISPKEEAREISKIDATERAIEVAMEYIHSHLDEDISLSDVAAVACLSEDYFGKLFKKNVGKSFTDYLLAVRMEKAISIIKTGKYSVNEISDMLGYKNSNYFIKVFRKYTGYTPKKYPLFGEEDLYEK